MSFRGRFRSWLEENVPPYRERLARTSNDAEFAACLRKWQKALYSGGWSGVSWPAEYGGKDATLGDQIAYLDEYDRSMAPPFIGVIGTRVVGPLLMQYGSATQRERYLPPILKGEHVWCQGFSESGAGSDLRRVATAVEVGPNGYRVNGRKLWVSWSPMADFMLLLGRVAKPEAGEKRYCLLLIDMASPGVAVHPIKQISGRALFGEVLLEDVEVPSGDLLGDVGAGWKMATSGLERERLSVTNVFLARHMSLRLVEGLGRTSDSASWLVSQIGLPRLICRVHAAQLSYLSALAKVEKGGLPAGEAAAWAAATKLESSELVREVAHAAMSMLGPDAFVPWDGWQEPNAEGLWPFLQLDTLKYAIGGGTSNVLRDMLGFRLLGLPRDE